MNTVRVLLPSDPFCPKCGHNRDKSSVSSIDEGGGVKSCQMCAARWREVEPDIQPVTDAQIDVLWEYFGGIGMGLQARQFARAILELANAPAPGVDACEAPSMEPAAWMHVQGNHFEPSLRELDDDEKARGWTQFPLYGTPGAAMPE